jgi:hypothetical protein
LGLKERRPHVLGESQRWKLHGKIIDGEQTDVGTAKLYGEIGYAAAKQAVVFLHDQLKTRRPGASAGIGKQSPH